MKNLNLSLINSELEKFAKDRDWDQFHSVKNLTMALSVETAELVEIFQWLNEEQSARVKDNPELMSKVQDEVADIFVYLLRIIGKTNIDLESAVLQKMEKNAAKYPIELAKGNAKKYNEY